MTSIKIFVPRFEGLMPKAQLNLKCKIFLVSSKIYLMTLSINLAIKRRFVRRWVNNKLEMIRKEAVLTWFKLTHRHFLEGTKAREEGLNLASVPSKFRNCSLSDI